MRRLSLEQTIRHWIPDGRLEWQPHLDLALVSVRTPPWYPRSQTDNDAIRRYESAWLSSPDDLPPVVAIATSDTVELIDGWHRTRAALATGRTTIPAWLITSPTELPCLLALAVDLNAHHGVPLTNADRVRQAKKLVAAGGRLKATAALVGIDHKTVERSIKSDRALTEIGIDGVETLTQQQRYRLMGLPSHLRLYAAAAVIRSGLGTQETSLMCSEVRRAIQVGNTQDAYSIVDRHTAIREAADRRASGPAARRRRGQTLDAAERLFRACGTVLRVPAADAAVAIRSGPPRALPKRVRATIRHLEGVLADLERGGGT